MVSFQRTLSSLEMLDPWPELRQRLLRTPAHEHRSVILVRHTVLALDRGDLAHVGEPRLEPLARFVVGATRRDLPP